MKTYDPLNRAKKGRKSPNLKKVGKNKVENQHGVTFTDKEKKKLESLVNSAMRKRKRMLDTNHAMEVEHGGKKLGITNSDLARMGKESDFVLAPKSKSLQRFKSKEEYKKYVKNLKKVVDRDYVEKRVAQYQKNDAKAMKRVFGRKRGNELAKMLKGISAKEFLALAQKDEVLEIGYIYSPEGVESKYNQLKATLKAFQDAPKKGR